MKHKLKVGKTVYTVVPVRELQAKFFKGQIKYGPRTIEVATHSYGRQRSATALQHTMWHEFVHAALYELKHPSYRNEALVDGLAKMIIAAQKQLVGTPYAGR